MADETQPDEQMDLAAVRAGLRDAIRLQARSVLGWTLAAGSLQGLELSGVRDRLGRHASAELDDLARLTEKLAALGGRADVEVADLPAPTGAEDLRVLLDDERQVLDALHSVIPHTGQQPHSEALEHLIEHVIMRKQRHVDWLDVALGRGHATDEAADDGGEG